MRYLITLFLFCVYSLSASLVELTEVEKQWLKQHPKIKVHNESNWAPFNFNVSGQPQGYSIDLMKLIAEKTGMQVEFISGPSWNEFLEMAKKGELDVMLNIVISPERAEYLNFSEPFLTVLHGIAMHEEDDSIKGFADLLKGKTIALEEGFFYHEYMKKNHPETKLHLVEDGLQTLQSVSSQKADATIGILPVMQYLAKNNFMSNIRFISDSDATIFKPIPLRIAARKDAPELISIIQKGFSAITPDEKRILTERWLGKQDNQGIQHLLTDEEKAWIEAHPTVLMGGEMDWPPFDYVDGEGVYQGIIKDYLALFEKRSGMRFEVKTGMRWKELVKALEEKKIDFLPALYSVTEERQKFGIFTKPYLRVKNVMFVRSDDKEIHKLQDIKKQRVAVIKGYATVKGYAPHLDQAEVVTVNSLIDAIYAVLNNQADVFMDSQLVVEYLMNKNLISGLKPIFLPSSPTESQLRMLIRNDEPILHSIIQKLLDSITIEDERAILEKWIFSGSLHFNAKEQEWIDKGIPIRYVFDPDWQPIEWANELGEHEGILSDVIELLQQKSGVEFQPVRIQEWTEARKMAKSRAVDMYSGIGETQERRQFMQFTQKNILTLPYVYVSRIKEEYLEGLDEIKGRRIMVLENSTIEGLLKERNPELSLLLVRTTEEGFEKVLDGKADLFVVNSALAKYYINRNYAEELKITGKPNIDLELKVAIRNDWPTEVVSLIDKSIEAITTKEMNDIIHKWTEVKVQETVNWGFILKIMAGVGLILLGVLYWNRTMAKEISRRKEAEGKLSEAMDALQISYQNMSDSIQYASLIQHAILPDQNLVKNAFHDSFVIWSPKDIVGGDIFLFEQLRHEDEYLMLVVDCTGHGVPGAFMTMLVKAIERNVLAEIMQSENEVSPSAILQTFNRSIRTLLKQESKESKSNAGFDGGILYIDKKREIIRFSGAETPLFYFDQQGDVQTIKGDRHGIGYRTSDPDYRFKEHQLAIGEIESLFVTTDGYLDQNGGEKGFPLGKKRFKKTLESHISGSMEKLHDILLDDMKEWQGSEPRNDDVTLIGIRFQG